MTQHSTLSSSPNGTAAVDWILETRALDVSYGGVQAVRAVSVHVARGESVALIGANGAGKTSFLRAVSRLEPASRGEIHILGREVTKASPHSVARLGVAHVPEHRKLFTPLSVVENLHLGAFRRPNAYREQRVQVVYDLFPVLRDRQSQAAGTLSGGEQQMLALGRALMSEPALLLLDEPSLGLAPKVAEQIFEVLAELKEGGQTTLLVEQNAELALETTDRAYVLRSGSVVVEGRSSDLVRDTSVLNAYLGEEAV